MTPAVEPISMDPPFRVASPVIRQSWLELTFLHWHFDPAAVRPLIPPELELDLWEGRAYVGLVPFILDDITLTKAPAVPWLSHFNETNVRTYVRDRHGTRGVWFFSLDAARLAAVIGARVSYALPYYWAKMSVHRQSNRVEYKSVRRHGPPRRHPHRRRTRRRHRAPFRSRGLPLCPLAPLRVSSPQPSARRCRTPPLATPARPDPHAR